MFQQLRLTRPLAILDTETTGLDPQRDRIVELAVLKCTPNGEHFSVVQRLNPGIMIPPAATAIHGICESDVAGNPSFGEVVAPLLDFLAECDFAGYGIKRFDLPFLHAEFGRVGQELPLDGRAIIDVLEIYHRREPRDLAAAVRQYCGREHSAAHAALADAAATAEVLDGMLACYADLPHTPADLDRHFRDPNAVDRAGRFVRDSEQIFFAFGRYRGRALSEVAHADPGYIRWMLSAGFEADTTSIAREALRQARLGGSISSPCRRPFEVTPSLASNLVTV